jgi:signal transduction histidine kinase
MESVHFDKLERENRLLREHVKSAQNRFEEKIAELSLIRELGMGLLYKQDFEQACDFILNVIIDNTAARNCSIMLLDRQESRLFLVSAADSSKNKFRIPAEKIFSKKDLVYSFALGEGVAGQAMLEKKPVVVDDASCSNGFIFDPESRVRIGSLLVIPMLVENQPIGVINLSHEDPHAFDADDVNVFSIIASYVAISLQNMLNLENLKIEIDLRKRVETELRQIQEELEIRIQNRTSDLAEANELLKNEINERKAAQAEALEAKEHAELANRAKTEFLANMSHELRTPLNHILGFTELVLDRHFGELNTQQTEFLEDVAISGKHLLSLINDILDLAKVEAGKLELELSEVDLAGLLQDSLIMIREKAIKHGIGLETDSSGISGKVHVDERKMRQILYNLLSNAAKFTPDGGKIRVSAETVRWEVRGGLRRSDAKDMKFIAGTPDEPAIDVENVSECILISVADSGIGIAKQNQERIFDAFEQVRDLQTGSKQGTGLGLSLTRKLVELHGGKIWVESDGAGKGSCFKFVLPAQEREDQKLRR